MAVPLFNIGGLASGLDTNSIIDSILKVEQAPIDQLQTRKQSHQLEDNAWQFITTKYSAIRSALDSLDSVSDYNKLAVSTSSNEDAVSVTVTGEPAAGTTSFRVDQLATNHQLISDTDFSGSDALVGSGDFTVTIGGADHTVTATSETTLAELAADLNALDAGVSASIVSVDGTSYKLVLSADGTGADNVFTTSGTVTSLGTVNTLQQGVDAQLTLGSGAGAITISRSSNTINDLISGATIELKATTTSSVSISTQRDVDGTVSAIKGLVDAVNATLGAISSATKYSPDTDSAGPLVGNSTARSLAIDLRSAISSTLKSGSTYPVASSVGISLNRDGTFDLDESKLRDALETDYDSVVGLLVEGGESADSRASFVASSEATKAGSYQVVVTQAATRAQATSSAYAAPGSDSTFQITVGSETVDVNLTTGMTITEAVDAINAALEDAGVTNVSASETNVSGTDYLQLDHIAYGSSASFTVAGDPFGLAGTYAGQDVAGTIGGEAATGSGRALTASSGDPEGLVVLISASGADVSGAGGSLSLGDFIYSRGVFGTLDQTVSYTEGTGGSIARAQDLTSSQIDLIDERIQELQDRLDRRQALLIKQYAALETAMANLQSQSQWLSAQLTSMSGSQ